VKQYRSGIRHDYKDSPQQIMTPQRRRWSWFAFGLSLPVATVSLLLVSERNESKVPAADIEAVTHTEAAPQAKIEAAPPAGIEPTPSVVEIVAPEAVAATEAASEAEPEEAPLSEATLDLLVDRGDTLEILFRRHGLNLTDLAAMAALPDAAEYLRLLRPGDEIQVAHRDGRVLALNREINDIDMLRITKSEAGFDAEKQQRDVEIRTIGAHGVIRTSLFEAGMAAGMSDAVTMAMANIFQWDVDFILDVRVGDTFTVIHEELWRDGVKLRNGDIIAAEFINQGKPHRAVRYADAGGRSDYYTPEGRSIRKAFIRAPVEFTRVSSRFNPNRRHPVLNTIRAHRGVDYAAPTGTPVIAAGDGKIILRGVSGGYGNAVILQHGDNITTLYGHLSRFGKPRHGNRVKQGDVIGYVGQSGLATGPHLHYEYRVGGVHRNPQTVPLPPADPVPAEYRDDFRATTEILWRELDLYQETHFAGRQAGQRDAG
jgi:murein DD-endopeptidase MepM/ murein hydrolase activator NlpD